MLNESYSGRYLEPTRETRKHRETLSGLDLRFVWVFRSLHFPILAVKLFKKHVSSFCDCAENLEKHQAEWPFEIQRPKTNGTPISAKWRQKAANNHPGKQRGRFGETSIIRIRKTNKLFECKFSLNQVSILP